MFHPLLTVFLFLGKRKVTKQFVKFKLIYYIFQFFSSNAINNFLYPKSDISSRNKFEARRKRIPRKCFESNFLFLRQSYNSRRFDVIPGTFRFPLAILRYPKHLA